MTKTFLFTLAFAVLASALLASGVRAEPAVPASGAPSAAKTEDYWLSNGLNRLVFWKAPLQSGRSVAKDPQKH